MKKLIVGFASLLMLSNVYCANNAPHNSVDAQIKMHEEMAMAHQEAASCLKSGKTLDDCQIGVKKAYQKNKTQVEKCYDCYPGMKNN